MQIFAVVCQPFVFGGTVRQGAIFCAVDAFSSVACVMLLGGLHAGACCQVPPHRDAWHVVFVVCCIFHVGVFDGMQRQAHVTWEIILQIEPLQFPLLCCVVLCCNAV
jgi:hypothetical protein